MKNELGTFIIVVLYIFMFSNGKGPNLRLIGEKGLYNNPTCNCVGKKHFCNSSLAE